MDQISGGQRQRVFIAMVLCQDTDYVLLDEPLNNLDMRHAVQTMHLARQLATDLGKTTVVVLHDINFAAHHADRIIAMKDGRVLADGAPSAIVTPEHIQANCGAVAPREGASREPHREPTMAPEHH